MSGLINRILLTRVAPHDLVTNDIIYIISTDLDCFDVVRTCDLEEYNLEEHTLKEREFRGICPSTSSIYYIDPTNDACVISYRLRKTYYLYGIVDGHWIDTNFMVKAKICSGTAELVMLHGMVNARDIQMGDFHNDDFGGIIYINRIAHNNIRHKYNINGIDWNNEEMGWMLGDGVQWNVMRLQVLGG